MFVSTAEQAVQASPNPFFAFIFCNLIILAIILRSKPGSSDPGSQHALPGFPRKIIVVQRSTDQIDHASHHPEGQVEEKPVSVQVSEVCNSEISRKEDHAQNSCCEYKNEDETVEYDYEAENGENRGEDYGNDDELRRRIEDFITKVNREWMEEKRKDIKPRLTLLDQPLTYITKEA